MPGGGSATGNKIGIHTLMPLVYNVLDDGAAGDGTTDDSVAVAATFTKVAAAGGGTIVFPPGKTFKIVTKFVVSGSNIVVQGYGATLRFQGANTTRLMSITGDNVAFFGLTFSGNSSQPSGSLVYVDDNVDSPWFIDCIFKDISATAKGTDMLNQTAALAVSPYSVTNGMCRNCLFSNITSTNTAGVVGAGFAGGIKFMKFDAGSPETLNPATDAQTVFTNFAIVDCTFDTIQTILASGLSDADVENFDDADAIRGYGFGTTGVTRVDCRVVNCRFNKVSKRAIKFSGVSGLSISNIELIADQNPYWMSVAMKVYGNAVIDGVRVVCAGKAATITRSGGTATVACTAHGKATGDRVVIYGANQEEYNGRVTITVTGVDAFTYTVAGAPATPATGSIRMTTGGPRVAIQCETIQTMAISNVAVQSAGYFLSFNDTTSPSPPQTCLTVSNVVCDNLYSGGINSDTSNSTSSYMLSFSSVALRMISDTGEGIETPLSNSNTDGKTRLYNVEVINGDVVIQGKDCVVDGLTITLNRSQFAGSVADRSLLQFGIPGATNYNVLRNIHVDVQSCLSTYLNATRTRLVLVAGDNTTVQNLSIRVPSTINGNTYAHASFYGSDCVVDGVSYWGHGFIECGVVDTSNGSVYSGIRRLGYGVAATPAPILTDASATNCVFENIRDFRTTATTPIDLSGGGPFIVDGVSSLSTKADPLVPDSQGTVRNEFRLQNIIRKENTVTVTANGQTISTLYETINLDDTTGGHTGVILSAPTREDLFLTILTRTGMSDVGVVADTTARFRAGAPTFGVGSADVASMLLKSTAGLWVEVARSTIP